MENLVYKEKLSNLEQEVVDYYLSGDYYFSEVAEKFNIKSYDVKLILIKAGITPKRRSHKIKKPTGTDEEIIELYKTTNIKKVAKVFNTTTGEIKKVLENNNIHVRTKEESTRLAIQNCWNTKTEIYGDPYYTNTAKASETKKNKTPEEKQKIYEKVKITLKEKYGDENYNLHRATEVLINKYGSGMFMGSPEFKLATEEYAINNFGSVEKYIKYVHGLASDKLMELYGSPCGFQSDYAREKAFSEESLLKQYETKRKNNTFNTSKAESEMLEFLSNMYPYSEIFTNYKCDRYPFKCDFYIKNIDEFIELNAHWTHGPHPFDPNNEDDIKLLNKWRSKQKLNKNGKKNSYYVAEEVWTKRDPEKLRVAKENGLHYVMIYKEGAIFI